MIYLINLEKSRIEGVLKDAAHAEAFNFDYDLVEKLPNELERYTNRELVALYNSVPDIAPIKRFSSQKDGIRRLAQVMGAAKFPSLGPTKARSKRRTRISVLVDLMQRPKGAAIGEIQAEQNKVFGKAWSPSYIRLAVRYVQERPKYAHLRVSKDEDNRYYAEPAK